MTSIVSSLLSLFSLNNTDRRGSEKKNPMKIVAAPGLMTLLDVALFRTTEGQLTGTLTTSHALLAAWIALQRRAVLVLEEISLITTTSNDAYYSTSKGQKRIAQMSSLARACFEAACDAIQLISTDRLASSANLSDPYSSSAALSQQAQQQRSTSFSLLLSTSASQQELLEALKESRLDTGRRRYPIQQRRKDCWESPRLFCPDHVWADEVWQAGQHVLRLLHKHPFALRQKVKQSWTTVEASLAGASVSVATAVASTATIASSQRKSATSNSSTGTAAPSGPTYRSDQSDSLLEEHMHLLWLILSQDLPTRLIQFKAAMEAEAVVNKRLYLVKCEYRAPFRSFLEAHHSVQRAPSLELVDEYLSLLTTSAASSSSNNRNNTNSKSSSSSTTASGTLEQRRASLKDRFQKLLQTPSLLEALALEQRCEEYESAMAQTLVSFCELARYLDQKRARIISCHDDDLRLTERLRRFKGLLCKSSSSSSSSSSSDGSSSGIRPLLLDLQGVATDEEEVKAITNNDHMVVWRSSSRSEQQQQPIPAPDSDGTKDNNNNNDAESKTPLLDMRVAMERVDQLLTDLQMLGSLCETRNAFVVEGGGKKSSDSTFDIPASIVRGCTDELDAELFRCHFKDWCAMVVRQHELTNNAEFEQLAEKLRRAEMQMGLASASTKSLQMIRQRLETFSTDREKRFEVLKYMLEEVCLREMNLHVTVEEPGCDKILSLPKTSALGVFGRALQMAGEPLPIG